MLRDGVRPRATGQSLFNVGVLRDALTLAKPFLPDDVKAKMVAEPFNTVQIFDGSTPETARGDGCLYCSDNNRAIYYECDALRGKPLVVHSRHVGKFLEFLSRIQSGEVALHRGTNMSFATARDDDFEKIFGWVHQVRSHSAFRHLGSSLTKYRLMVPKGLLLSVLQGIRIALSQSPQDRVHITYSHANRALRFLAAESACKFESVPIDARDKTGTESCHDDFHYTVDLKGFTSLVTDIKSEDLELHVAPIPAREGQVRSSAALIVVEEYTLDAQGKVIREPSGMVEQVGGAPEAYRCKVTRLIPSTI